jgi:hypothetical protein
MSIGIIQEKPLSNFKATLCAPSVELKKYWNEEFGVRNAEWGRAARLQSGKVR